MWEHNVLNLIVASLVSGAVCGALWDFFRIQRILFGIPECVVPRLKDKNLAACVLVALQDLLFLVLAACVLAVAFYYGNNGNFQLYALAFAALGMTVYSKTVGSAAAPTAGLHFTKELLEHVRAMGVKVCYVTLHVGLGTFRPVKAENLDEHEMHSEYICVTEESARIINERRAAGGRIIAIGTTSCRVLESAADENGILHPVSADTGIFIYPGYRFKATDALITNFHLPKSTLLMLVSAFYEREKMLEVYNTAVREKYRFFSFGDAMFIE